MKLVKKMAAMAGSGLAGFVVFPQSTPNPTVKAIYYPVDVAPPRPSQRIVTPDENPFRQGKAIKSQARHLLVNVWNYYCDNHPDMPLKDVDALVSKITTISARTISRVRYEMRDKCEWKAKLEKEEREKCEDPTKKGRKCESCIALSQEKRFLLNERERHQRRIVELTRNLAASKKMLEEVRREVTRLGDIFPRSIPYEYLAIEPKVSLEELEGPCVQISEGFTVKVELDDSSEGEESEVSEEPTLETQGPELRQPECPLGNSGEVSVDGDERNSGANLLGMLSRKSELPKRPFACPVEGCGRRYQRHGVMRQHMMAHNRKTALPFKCPCKGCERLFASATHLRKHTRVHNNTGY